VARPAEHPTAYYPNGAISIMTQKAFTIHRSCYTDVTVAYEMVWPDCLDIDEPEDLELARRLAGGA